MCVCVCVYVYVCMSIYIETIVKPCQNLQNLHHE